MSGVTLDDIAENQVVGVVEEFEGKIPTTFVEEQPSRANEFVSKMLTATTGVGSIESYLDHPMNFSKSLGLAQIIRGLSGLIGSLDLAMIDVVMGGLRFSKEKRGIVNGTGISSGGNLSS